MQYIVVEQIDDKGPVLLMNNSCFPLSPRKLLISLHNIYTTQHIGSYIPLGREKVNLTIYKFCEAFKFRMKTGYKQDFHFLGPYSTSGYLAILIISCLSTLLEEMTVY